MKTITIPKKFGYPTLDITVNGKEYTVKSGEEITIEDHIAEAIENAIALAPKFGRNISKFAQLAEGSIEEITASDLEGIKWIRGSAFYSCKSIEKVTIPDNINEMASHIFYGCSNIKSVKIGNGLKSFSANIFDGCTSLTSVYLPEVPPSLANTNAFNNINPACVFYCKTEESLEAYRAAANWSTLAGEYSFVVES